jgi:hypothetical protein
MKISGLLLAVCLLLGLWFIALEYSSQKDEGVDFIKSAACDIRKPPCTAKRGKQQIRFAIESNEIRSFVPLTFKVWLTEIDAKKITIDFEGVDMYMGIISLALDETAEATYTATSLLPGHVNQSMIWRAKILVQQGENVIGTAFEFPLK